MNDTIQLHALNLELIQTLSLVGHRLIEYTKEYGIKVEGLDALSFLLKKAENLMEQIAHPYQSNPLLSDAILQGKRSDEDLTEPN